MSERAMLLEYGTRAINLTPSSILAAAAEDLRRKQRNQGYGISGGLIGNAQLQLFKNPVGVQMPAKTTGANPFIAKP